MFGAKSGMIIHDTFSEHETNDNDMNNYLWGAFVKELNGILFRNWMLKFNDR